MIGSPYIFHLPYIARNKQYRILWHQTLDEIIRYPTLPRRCTNFDLWPMPAPKINKQTTLASVVTTRHQEYLEDATLTEIWMADDLSMLAGFFYELWRFFKTPLDAGDYLVWYPKDKIDTAFCIELLRVSCGDTESQSINPIHKLIEKDYRWLKDEVRMEFKVQRVFDTPDAIAYLEGQ